MTPEMLDQIRLAQHQLIAKKAIELRQSSPFTGVLSPEEIARAIQREKERARALTGS